MSIEALAAPALNTLTTAPEVAAPWVTKATAQVEGGAFQSLLSAVNQVNNGLNASEQGLQDLAVGNIDNLHQSVMNMERVRLSLQLLLEVRSRALDAYQELMRMQV